MLSEFIIKKLKEAQYKILDDGSYFGEIPSLKGVWANTSNLEDCREELRGVFEEWLVLHIQSGTKISGLAEKTRKHELVK